MSTVKKKKPAIRDPFTCSYAPTDAAKCKSCNNPIAKGSIRFERKVHSPFHDGLDTHFHHIECGWDWASSLYQIRDWSSLKWNDILYVGRLFGEMIDVRHPLIKMVKTYHQGASRLTSSFALVPDTLFIDLNFTGDDRGFKKKKLADEIRKDISDALIHGKPPSCPICRDQLVGRYPTLKCYGLIEGQRCTFLCNNIDIISPDTPHIETLPVPVSRDRLERSEPFSLPGPFLNVPEVAETLKRFFASDTIWPSTTRFGPYERWLRASKRSRRASQQDVENKYGDEENQDESEPDLEDKDLPILAGIRLFLINSKSRSHLMESCHKSQIKIVTDIHHATYAIVSEKHASSDLKLSATTEAIGLGVPILFDSFISASLQEDALPESLPSIRTKSLDYISLLKDPTSKENHPIGDSFVFPKGRYVRMRRYAQWYWSGKGPAPKQGAMTMIPRFEKIKAQRYEVEKLSSDRRKRLKTIDEQNRNEAPPTPDPQASLDLDELGFSNVQVATIDLSFEDTDLNAYLHAIMHCADVSTGANKFYKAQVLTAGSGQIYLFKSWGKVGGGGIKDGSRLEPYHRDLSSAIDDFKSLCQRMTRVDFIYRFVDSPIQGFYTYIDDGGSSDRSDQREAHENDGGMLTSSPDDRHVELSIEVEGLIRQLFNERQIKDLFADSQLDLDNMAIRDIKPEQIRKALSILSRIEDVLSTAEKGDGAIHLRCEGLSSQFYTLLPHIASPTAITSLHLVRAKSQMLNDFIITLSAQQIQANVSLSRSASKEAALLKTLKCDLNFISEERYGPLEKAVVQSLGLNGPTHSFQLSPVRLYSIDKPEATTAAREFNDIENRKLLWHGSLRSNWAGILASGLRNAPAEAPKTGYMFGKGVYFADVAAKSGRYSFPAMNTSDTGSSFILLSEVIIGDPIYTCAAEYSIQDRVTGNYGHVHALGKYRPTGDPLSFPSTIFDCPHPVTLAGGKVAFDKTAEDSDLLYNEYVVYDPKRIIPRYLVEIRLRSLLDIEGHVKRLSENTEKNADVHGLLDHVDISEDSEDD